MGWLALSLRFDQGTHAAARMVAQMSLKGVQR